MSHNLNLIHQNNTILDALKRINSMVEMPLVLFVLDDESKMVGTLTDGDIRRALISGAQVDTPISEAMRKEFRFIRHGESDDVRILRDLKTQKITLIPILDDTDRIVEIINLEKFINRLPIDAVLMAGGKGERLRPLTEKTPKPLIKVGDKAIIDYNVERLISFGVKHINVTVNYLKEQLIDHFAQPFHSIQVNTVSEPKFLGTMGSIKFVKEFNNDVVLMMNSDIFTNIDYEKFYLHFKEHNADMSIVAVPYTVTVPYGIFSLEGREVTGLLEKPTYNYYSNAGIYLFKRELLDLIPEDTFYNATDFIEMLVEKKYKVVRYPFNGTWIDIGNHQEYQKANELVKHIQF